MDRRLIHDDALTPMSMLYNAKLASPQFFNSGSGGELVNGFLELSFASQACAASVSIIMSIVPVDAASLKCRRILTAYSFVEAITTKLQE